MCYREDEHFRGSNIDDDPSTFHYPDVKSAKDCQEKCNAKFPDCCKSLERDCWGDKSCEVKVCRYFTFQFSPIIECNLKHLLPEESGGVLESDGYVMGPRYCNTGEGI